MKPLYLLGIDGIGYHPLRRWIEKGHLPSLRALTRKHNTCIRMLHNKCLMRTENAWLTFAQGVLATASHEWAHCAYNASNYSYCENPTYSFHHREPFFRQSAKRSLIFDMPLVAAPTDAQDFKPGMNVEIQGWGTEANQASSTSWPPEELLRLEEIYGKHPVYSSDVSGAQFGNRRSTDSIENRPHQYKLPNIYNRQSLLFLRDQLCKGAKLRSKIVHDLLKRHRPDLAICTYSEGHTAGHMFWHSSQPHPLRKPGSHDLLLDVLQEIDRGIGDICRNFEDADVIIFSPHGMQANFIELSSSAFLPEMLFRYSMEGELLGGRQACTQDINYSQFTHWKDIMFSLVSTELKNRIDSPISLDDSGDPMNWSPARWYQPLWPQLKAFALPSYSEGLVRLNVSGRDGGNYKDGLITANEYEKACTEISVYLSQWRDANSGKKIVGRVLRTRANPWDVNGAFSSLPADLVVQWREPLITNHIAHPEKGEIGPFPYFRTGAHCHQGMVIDLRQAQEPSSCEDQKLQLVEFSRSIACS